MNEAATYPGLSAVVPFRTAKGKAVRAALILLLLSTTVFQQIGVKGEISIALVAGYGFVLVAALAGALLVSVKRLILYGVCISIATASLVLSRSESHVEQASFPSLALLAVMYLPFTLSLKPNFLAASDAAWVREVFLNVTLSCAAAGILQFYAQFFIHAGWLFNFGAYLPAALQSPGRVNTVIPVGSLFNKANGFFFSEPSGFSFLMALGFHAESASHRRVKRLACMGFALLLSYSGTGVLTLLIGILFPIGRKTLQRVLVVATFGGLAVWLLSDALNLSFTLGRVTEFQRERTSGYIRYVAPLRLIADTWHTEAWTFWLGHGPGMITRHVMTYQFHDPTWAKLLFEYGGLGFVAFVALVFATLRSTSVPIQVRAALFFSWLIMGGHLLSAQLNFLILGLVGLLPRPTADPLAGRLTAENQAVPVLRMTA